MNKDAVWAVILLVFLGLCGLFFSNYRQVQNELSTDMSMYTKNTKVISVDYERIFGYAPMDSTVPPVTGIKANYTYQVDNQNFTAKQTFYKKGFREIMNAINNNPTQLEVRYKLSNPEESIITIKKIGGK